MRKPRVLRPETRDYGDLRCPNCNSSAIMRLGTSNVLVWDYREKKYVVIPDWEGKDGMMSNRQFKSTFKCGECGYEWSIISGI
jgi:hypothetical protein